MAGIDPNRPGVRPDLTNALRQGAETPAGERLGVPRNQVLRSTTPEPPPPPKPAPIHMDTVRLSPEATVDRQEVLIPRGAVRWKMLESVVAELARNRGPGTETSGEAPPLDDQPPPAPRPPPPLVHISGARPEQPVPHLPPPAAPGAGAEPGGAPLQPQPQAAAVPPPAQSRQSNSGRILAGLFLTALGLSAVLILWVLMDIWGLR